VTAPGTTPRMTPRSLPWRRTRQVLPLVAPYGGYKDPCVVRFRGAWHLFATGCKEGWTYDVVHAVAKRPGGPWTMLPPADVVGCEGPSLCAPGVVAEGERLHMFVQEAYNLLGGNVSHLVSDDGGATFVAAGVALTSLPGTSEAGIYDAHPSEVAGAKWLVYSGMATVGEPDLHLARSASGTWDGPWERLGMVLGHDDVAACHNARGCPEYEWGLEGGQLVGLPDGRALLVAVCFLPVGAVGTRQRLVLAVAGEPAGPFTVLGPAIEPADYGRTGENGHGAAVVDGRDLHVYFQHRDGDGLPWTLRTVSVRAGAVPRTGDLGLAGVA
jgi:hypothetical protein